MKKVVVMSLGGSTFIYRDKIDYNFLKKFKRLITKIKDRKFVVVAGGGSTARKYMDSLDNEKINERTIALIGVGITRLNARFLANFFGKLASQSIPKSLGEVKNLLRKNRIVFTGGLRFEPHNTTDGTSASIANHLRTDFVNMTLVDGIYNKNPLKYKNVKFIPYLNAREFYNKMRKIKYKPGQHLLLDQHAASIIYHEKVKTIIIGKNLKNFENYLRGKNFKGSIIS